MKNSHSISFIIVGILFLVIAAPFSSAVVYQKQMNNKLPFDSFDGSILYVGGSGPENYSSIQEAINAASAGDMIYVYDDSSPYYEHLVIHTSLYLIGENNETTVIDGSNSDVVVRITANDVYVSGFTIQNSGQNQETVERYDNNGLYCGVETAYNISIIDNIFINNPSGMILWSNENTIRNNIVRNNEVIGIEITGDAGGQPPNSYDNIIEDNTIIGTGGYNSFGILMARNVNKNSIIQNTIENVRKGIKCYGSNENTITDNIINNVNYGIHTYLSYVNKISYNDISDFSQIGIYLEGYHGHPESNNNTISYNTLNGDSSSVGIKLFLTRWNTLSENMITQTSTGIAYYDTFNNTCFNNILLENYIGFSVWYSHDNVIFENLIQDNEIGFDVVGSHYNNFYHNNMISNLENANDNEENIWDDDYPSGGNYWDDYSGNDDNGDGIGDTPYVIPGGDNVDRYPLMVPFNNENNPPYNPSNPDPEHGAIDVDIDADLSWTCGDPDPWDTVTFDIYFGTDSNPPLLESNHPTDNYNLESLEYGTQYYWKIVARDLAGETNENSEVWTFTTEVEGNNPDLEIRDILGGVGINVLLENTGDVDVENIQLTITLEDGLLLCRPQGGNSTQLIPYLQYGYELNSNTFVFGLGKFRVSVAVEATGVPLISKIESALVVGPFVLILS